MVCNIFHVVDMICLNGNGMVLNQVNNSAKKYILAFVLVSF